MLRRIWKWADERRRRQGYEWMQRQISIHGEARIATIVTTVMSSRNWSETDPYCKGVRDALDLHTIKRSKPSE